MALWAEIAAFPSMKMLHSVPLRRGEGTESSWSKDRHTHAGFEAIAARLVLKKTVVRHWVYPSGLLAFALPESHLNLQIRVVRRPVSTGMNPVAELV